MHTQSQRNGGIAFQYASRFTQFLEAASQALTAVVRRAVADWKRRRQARATYDALNELDSRMLRDLGFDRSEIGSIAAEVAGGCELTRARLVQGSRDLQR